MSPEAALEKQIEIYRRMTGDERLLIGLRLHELSCEVAREGIRAQFPNASLEKVEWHLRRRIAASYVDELRSEKMRAYLKSTYQL